MREIGVAHSDGITAFFSLDPNRFYGIFALEGGNPPIKTPAEMDAEFEEMLGFHEARAFVVVVEGSAGWIITYRQQLKRAQFLVCCASEEVLLSIGIKPFDVGWTPDKPPVESLTQVLLSDGRPTARPSRWGRVGAAVAGIVAATGTSSGEEPHTPSPERSERVNSLIYDAPWGGNAMGRVEPDGTVFNDGFAGQSVGRVTNNGEVYDDIAVGALLGRVAADGTVMKGDLSSSTFVGRLDQGLIYIDQWGGSPIARVDPATATRAAAAALLLLGVGQR